VANADVVTCGIECQCTEHPPLERDDLRRNRRGFPI
jgi:hypothetical protein